MVNYVVAIPSYKRQDILIKKSLKTLKDGGVDAKKIHIFVANDEERVNYEKVVPKALYGKIVVGEKGIANQRKFIVRYFPENQYVISIDDDIEQIEKMNGPTKLVKITNVDKFFQDAHAELVKNKMFIWGIYPVRNPFFMKPVVSTNLRFIIGVLRGFINRHSKDLEPSTSSEGKEDYEQSILYYKKDGGVLRYNNITTKTKFNAEGGLGKDRQEMNRKAAEYLKKTYPDIVSVFHRKNGMTEVKIRDKKTPGTTSAKTKQNRSKSKSTKKNTTKKARSLSFF